jgi:hypothetical protein
MTITLCGNFGVEISSRIVRRYAPLAIATAIMKNNPPMLPNFREQIAKTTSRIAPNPYTLWDGVKVTGLPGKL